MTMLAAAGGAAAAVALRTEADAYTRYELLARGSSKFRIIYDVTATTAAARVCDNPIRRGSEASEETVTDRAAGQPRVDESISAQAARADGVQGDVLDHYLRVHLSRPALEGGGGIRID